MANELIFNYPAGNTLYAVLFNAVGQVWNGSTFETPLAANWATYDIAMTEVATTGIYRGAMPAAAAGVYSFVVRKQAGGSPAVGDINLGSCANFQWDGSVELPLDNIETDIAALNDPTAAAIADAICDELLSGHTTIGSLAQAISDVLTDTGTDGVALSTAVKQAVADEVLKRGVSIVEDAADAHSLTALILAALESAISGTTWTINKTDGTTFETKTVTTDAAANPIVAVT